MPEFLRNALKALGGVWLKLRGEVAARAKRRAARSAQHKQHKKGAAPSADPGAPRAARPRWRRVWIGCALAPVALLAVLFGLLLLFDPGAHREWIAGQASARLGRPVQIGALDWRWWPHLDLALEDVAVGAAAADEPELARFARLRIALRPLSLLWGPLQIENFELHGLRMQLGGRAQEQPAQPQKAAEESPADSRSPLAALPRIALARAEIRDAALSLHGADGAQALRIEEIAAQLGPDGKLNAALKLHTGQNGVSGALQLAGALSAAAGATRLQPLHLSLQLEGGALPGGRGALNFDGGLALTRDGALQAAPFTLQGLGLQVAGRGRFAPPAVQGHLEAQGEDLPRLLKLYALLSGGAESLPARIADAYDAARVARAARSFALGGRFDLDLAAGRAEARDVEARILGVQLAGHLAPASAGGELPWHGELQLRAARSVAPLLRALGQPQLARRIRALRGSAQIEADPAQSQLALSPLKLQVTLAGAAEPLALSARARWRQGRAEVSQLRLSGPGMQLSGDLQLQQAPLKLRARLRAPEIAPRLLLALLQKSPPEMADPNALRRASLDGALHHESGRWQLALNELQLDDTTLRGEGSFTPGDLQQATLRLDIGRLDLDRYLPPRAPENQVRRGGAAAGRAVANAGDGGGAAGNWAQRLRRLALSGDVKVQELILRGLRMQQIELALRREGEMIRLAPLAISAYGGRLDAQGDLDLAPAAPRFALRGAARQIELGAALRDLNGHSRLEGVLDLDLQLKGAALSGAALKHSLQGRADLQVRDGAYRGIDIRRQIGNWRRLIGGRGSADHRDDSNAHTEFETLAAKLRIEEGVVHNDSLSANAPLLHLTGKGRYRLADNHLDYRATAHLGPARPPLSAPVPIRITGNPPRLLYIPDLSSLVQQSLGKIGKTLLQGVRDAVDPENSTGGEEPDGAQQDDKLKPLRKLLPF